MPRHGHRAILSDDTPADYDKAEDVDYQNPLYGAHWEEAEEIKADLGISDDDDDYTEMH